GLHRVLERLTVRGSVVVEYHHLTVQDQSGLGEFAKRGSDKRETVAPILVVTGLQDHSFLFLDGDDSIAIEFSLVEPAVSRGDGVDQSRKRTGDTGGQRGTLGPPGKRYGEGRRRGSILPRRFRGGARRFGIAVTALGTASLVIDRRHGESLLPL